MKKMLESFNHAINGIVDAARTQRNMKIHLVAAVLALGACFFLDISKVEFLALAITITMVITAEMINTAIEAVVDLNTNFYKLSIGLLVYFPKIFQIIEILIQN